MAEALNNQRYWRNTRAGTSGRIGGGLLGASSSGTYQMPMEETAEQHAQARNEGYEGTQVGQEQGRQDDMYRLPLVEQALSGSWDKTLKLWDVATGREVQ
jgi:hypothetical protein